MAYNLTVSFNYKENGLPHSLAVPNGVEIMFGGRLGVPELLLILGIALILFGPSKLGDLGKGLGDAIRNFKGAMKDGEQAQGQPTPPAQTTQPTDKV